MNLNQILELSMVLDNEHFQKVFARSYNGEDYIDEDSGEYMDRSLSGKGITVIYRDSQYKKKIRLIVNAYLSKVDMDEMIKKNLEKANAKRAKKGLPPQKISQNAMVNAKNIQAAQQREEQARNEKLEKTKQQVKESNEYYNKDAKPGSLAAKAAMVAKYNEKHNK